MPNFTELCGGLSAIGDSWGITLILVAVVYALYKTQMRNMDIDLMIHDDMMFPERNEIEFILDEDEDVEDSRIDEEDIKDEPRAKK
jgi:hypothetical protein